MICLPCVRERPALHRRSGQEIPRGRFQCHPRDGIYCAGEYARDPLSRPRVFGSDDLDDDITGAIAGIFRKADRNPYA